MVGSLLALCWSPAVEKSGIRFISFPIPDRGIPASTRDAVRLMGEIANALQQGKNVAVHCRQGVGRSGLIAAGVLMNSGMNPGEAIRVVSSVRGAAIPETSEQRQWTEQLPLAVSAARK